MLFRSWKAASELAVIGPKDHTDATRMATLLISQARRIYFLGFGFDKNNLAKLGFPLSLPGPAKREIFFTNYQNQMTVNRKAATAFRQLDLHDRWTSHDTGIRVLKSERNVYDAINLDFGHFED